MGNSISANFATPMASTANSSSSSSSSDSTSAEGLGSTFLTLLGQELMHQDPTDPMDSTAMVGQMISLNQLQQLISIKEQISDMSSSTSSSTSSSNDSLINNDGHVVQGNATVVTSGNSLNSQDKPSSTSTGSEYTNALAEAINSSRSIQSSNLTNAIASTAGGK